MNVDFARMRDRWRQILTGGAELDAAEPQTAACLAALGKAAGDAWSAMEKAPGRACLWEDLAGTDGSHLLTTAYIRIKSMALAHELDGTGLTGNPALLADLIGALDWMHAERYHAGLTPYSNWWHWQIGAPLALLDTVMLLHGSLTPRQLADYMSAIAHFVPQPPLPGNYTGANRIWVCLVNAGSAMIQEDGARLTGVRDDISPVFPFVDAGEGFHPDGSFIMHWHFAYTGSYGISMLQDLVKLMFLLAGTAWEINDPQHMNVYRWVLDGFEPVMFKGGLMDMTRGREISRSYSQEHDAGHHVIEAVMRLARIAPPEIAERLKRMAKAWILQDTYLPLARYEEAPYGGGASLETIAMAAELLRTEAIQPRESYDMCKIFFAMARAVVHREHFAAGISMFSDRVGSYESINGENLKGWYTAHGMLYLYNDDLGQFSDGFWATVNPYRLPGTTVTAAPRDDGFGCNQLSTRTWVGGAVIDGKFGAAGMELEDYRIASETPPLTAKKSWFLFDREIVALGSDITAEESVRVETIVENRKLSAEGDQSLQVNGRLKPSHPGWTEELPETAWIHLEGTNPAEDIGYYFPGSPTLRGLRETRSGSWYDISKGEGSGEDPWRMLARSYLTIWFDHGVRPRQDGYAYVLLPGMTAAQVAAYARDPQLAIVEQSAEAHAVYHKQSRIWGVNVWSDTTKSAGPITVRQPASVMLQEKDAELAIALSDPTRQQDQLVVDIALGALQVKDVDPGITVDQLSPVIRLVADVRGAQGRTLQITLFRGQG